MGYRTRPRVPPGTHPFVGPRVEGKAVLTEVLRHRGYRPTGLLPRFCSLISRASSRCPPSSPPRLQVLVLQHHPHPPGQPISSKVCGCCLVAPSGGA